ncbi:unnamed protein product [Closterium sp. NIES-54]
MVMYKGWKAENEAKIGMRFGEVKSSGLEHVELPLELSRICTTTKQLSLVNGGEEAKDAEEEEEEVQQSEYEECAFAFFSPVEMPGEPATLKEALEGSDAEEWKKAIESELKSIEENGTWELVELPEGRKAMTSKWLFKIKSDADGKIERYKSRLVAKGYQQKEKVDNKELFAPVVKPTTLRTLLAGAAIKRWVVKQMYVTTAFLKGVLEEEIFMAQQEGFDDGSGREIGFTPSMADDSLFMLGEGEQRSFMVVYVEDILIFSPSSNLVHEVMLKLQDKFKYKALGDVSFCLGLHIEGDVEKRCMRVHQRKYLEALAANFGQSEGHVATPFPSKLKCVKGTEEESVGEEERRRFHSAFMRYKLLKLVMGEEKMREEGDARDRWIEKSAVLYDLILQSVNNDMFQHIKDLVELDDSGPKAWKLLRDVIQPNTLPMVIVLEKELAALSMRPGDDVKPVLDKIKDTYSRMAAAASNVSQMQQCTKIISVLDNSWDNLIPTLNTQQDQWTPEWLQQQILQEDFRRRHTGGGAANKTAEGYGAARGSGGRGGRRGRGRGRGLGAKSDGAHGKADPGMFLMVEDVKGSGGDVGSVGKVVMHPLTHWVIDSGCTSHMTPWADLLDEVKPPGKIKFVAAASGALLPVIGVGNAKVMGANGGLVGLGNVLLVEGLSANLFSVRRLQKSKAKVTFGPTSCRAKVGKLLLWDLEEKSSCIKDLWQLPIIPWNGKQSAMAAAAATAKATAGAEETTSSDGALDAVKKVQ